MYVVDKLIVKLTSRQVDKLIVKLSIKHVNSSRWHSRRYPTFFINRLHGLLGYMVKKMNEYLHKRIDDDFHL